MSDTIFDEDFDNDFTTKSRPDFLTTLIILTWVAVGFTVLGSVSSFMNSGNSLDQMDEAMAVFENMPTDNQLTVDMMIDVKLFFQVSIDNLQNINISNLILYLLEGFAALLMFNLNKMGYWLYLLCQIGFLVVASSFYPSDNIMTSFLIGYTLFTSILFLTLYGVNLKHLK